MVVPTSVARKRTRIVAVGAIAAAISNSRLTHPPVVPAPIGPTVSRVVHVAPSSLEICATNVSPVLFVVPRWS